MTTVTRKQIKTLVMLANKCSKIASAHAHAVDAFTAEFEKITGVAFDVTPKGFEDPIVDVIQYGVCNATVENLTKEISDYCEDIEHSILFE